MMVTEVQLRASRAALTPASQPAPQSEARLGAVLQAQLGGSGHVVRADGGGGCHGGGEGEAGGGGGSGGKRYHQGGDDAADSCTGGVWRRGRR